MALMLVRRGTGVGRGQADSCAQGSAGTASGRGTRHGATVWAGQTAGGGGGGRHGGYCLSGIHTHTHTHTHIFNSFHCNQTTFVYFACVVSCLCDVEAAVWFTVWIVGVITEWMLSVDTTDTCLIY